MALFARPRSDSLDDPDRARLVLDAAMRISHIAASAASLPDALREVVRIAIQLMGADQGSVMLQGDDGSLTLVASHGLPAEIPVGYQLKAGESVAGRVLATNKGLCLDRVDNNAFVNFVAKSRPIRSSVVVPLRIDGCSAGVLSLAVYGERPRYTEDDLQVAQMFADNAAGLIHRARLQEQAENRSSELMALVEASRGLLGTLDLDSLMQNILDGGCRLAGHRDGFACLFEPDTGALTRGVFRGMDKSLIRDLINETQVRAAVENSDAVYLESGGKSLVAVGFRTTGETRGVLLVRAETTIASERRDVLRAFGQQCATAIGAAELHTKIQQKETQLSSIIQGVPNPLVLVDTRGRIAALNSAAEQVFAVSAMFSVDSPVRGGLDHPEVEQLLEAQGDVQAEVMAGTPPRTHKARVTDVRLPGVPVGRVLIMDDVSAERSIINMQRDFVAVIGHELRTPLTIVKGFTKALLRKLPNASSDYLQDALQTVEAKSEQLERLIEDLLYVSQIEAREASLRIEQVDIVALVHIVSGDLLEEHAQRQIKLEIPDELTWACDETKVGLIVRHLIENALKYSESPHPVTVRATIDEADLRIEVQDRGVGIVSSDIPLIFERFRQLDGSSTRGHGGTGVGLYLCDRLVRVHEGRIWVDSVWGKGSTFSFTLPRRGTTTEVPKLRSELLPAASSLEVAS